MQDTTLRRRITAATAGVAIAVSSLAAGAASATAAPSRDAETSTDDTYLADTVGLPTETIVDTVTYDRFQWLLRQPGQFAFIVGSKGTPGFNDKVKAADAAARASNATKIYWFDPNLTGLTGVRNLDTRNPGNINLGAASQGFFSRTWQNVVGQSLGNGITSVANGAGNSVTITTNTATVNDSVNPAWDFRAGETPAAGAADTVFFTFDKDRQVEGVNDKVVDWVNLSTESVEDIATKVPAAITAAGGGAALDQVAEFKWWQSENNRIQDQSNGNKSEAGIARYGGDILVDSDADNGWNVEQLTYPELIHLLEVKDSPDKNFVILFGGTWCPNTRAVIKFVNDQAVDNNVKVYNFDWVLDGGKVNGTNGGGNPIHVRDNANSGSTFNFRPSYVYGDVVRTYLRNLITQYDPHSGNRVSYYPAGDLNAFPDVVRKLQVPFLINFQRGTANNVPATPIKRQWIQQNIDPNTGLATFNEYMTNWWFTNPSAQLGLSFAIPEDESTLTDPQKLQLAQARANAAFAAEAVDKLDLFFGGLPGAVRSTQTVTSPSVAYGKAPAVTLAIANKYGRVPAGVATLTVNGVDYQAPVAQNSAVFTLPKYAPGVYSYTISYAGDAQVKAFETSGSVSITKGKVSKTAGAVSKVPTTKKAGKYAVTVTTPAGLSKATGKVTVTLKKGKSTKKVTGTLKSGKVTIAVPKLAKGTWKVSVAYPGDAKYLKATATGKAIVVKK